MKKRDGSGYTYRVGPMTGFKVPKIMNTLDVTYWELEGSIGRGWDLSKLHGGFTLTLSRLPTMERFREMSPSIHEGNPGLNVRIQQLLDEIRSDIRDSRGGDAW